MFGLNRQFWYVVYKQHGETKVYPQKFRNKKEADKKAWEIMRGLLFDTVPSTSKDANMVQIQYQCHFKTEDLIQPQSVKI